MAMDAINRLIPIMQVDPPRVWREQQEQRTAVVTAIRALNKSELFGSNRELKFARDSSTDKLVIQIVDRNTGEMVQQIPAQDVLRMMANITQPGKK